MFNPNSAYMPLRALAPAAKKTFDWAALLTNTQKTLNIVNQAIPIVYQAKPIVKNARTMFRVASAFTKSGNNNQVNTNNTNTYNTNNNVGQTTYDNQDDNYVYDENQPSFFI